MYPAQVSTSSTLTQTPVAIKKNWTDSKTYCEEQGEYLATFETLESARWITDTINVTAGSYNYKTLGYI